MLRKLILAFGLGTLALTASACNTVRGAGEDVQDVSHDVDKAI